MESRRPATLTQVAERAGVSLTTASKVINDTGRISQETRQRVKAVAADLRFIPNPHARSLHSGRTSIVGALILDSHAQRFAMPLIIGADTALSEINLSMIACDAKGDITRARMLLDMLRRRTIDGLIVIGEHQVLWPSLTADASWPVVYVHGETDDPSDTVFLADDNSGMAAIADHLVSLGRRRVLHVTGPRRSRAVQRRVAGLRAALRRSPARLTGPVIYGQWSQQWAYGATADLLHKYPDVDAVICGSDQIASGAVAAILGSGRSIPGDVAVTGFDNWDVFALESTPALTTVDMNIEQLGVHAAQALHTVLSGGHVPPGVHRLPCSLVVRGSTRPD